MLLKATNVQESGYMIRRQNNVMHVKLASYALHTCHHITSFLSSGFCEKVFEHAEYFGFHFLYVYCLSNNSKNFSLQSNVNTKQLGNIDQAHSISFL